MGCRKPRRRLTVLDVFSGDLSFSAVGGRRVGSSLATRSRAAATTTLKREPLSRDALCVLGTVGEAAAAELRVLDKERREFRGLDVVLASRASVLRGDE